MLGVAVFSGIKVKLSELMNKINPHELFKYLSEGDIIFCDKYIEKDEHQYFYTSLDLIDELLNAPDGKYGDPPDISAFVRDQGFDIQDVYFKLCRYNLTLFRNGIVPRDSRCNVDVDKLEKHSTECKEYIKSHSLDGAKYEIFNQITPGYLFAKRELTELMSGVRPREVSK